MKERIGSWTITSNMRPVRLLSYNELTDKEKGRMPYFESRPEEEKSKRVFFRHRGRIEDVTNFVLLPKKFGRWSAAHQISMWWADVLTVDDDRNIVVGHATASLD